MFFNVEIIKIPLTQKHDIYVLTSIPLFRAVRKAHAHNPNNAT